MNIFIFILFHLILRPSLAVEDECLKDYKSKECQRSISTALFFYSTSNEKNTSSEMYKNRIEKFYKKYGIDGFTFSQEDKRSLFEAAFLNTSHKLDFLKERLFQDWKKGTLINGKSVFELLIVDRLTLEDTLDNLIFQLDNLFPPEGNSNLELTEKKFGLPWDDKNFIDGYVNELKDTIREIDETNAFFKRYENLEQKEKLLKIIGRLEPLAKIHLGICNAKTQQEIDEAKLKLPNIFLSSEKDIIGCLLKNNQCELVDNLIKSGEYPVNKLRSYFDSIYMLKESPQCSKALKSTYEAMLEHGVKPGKYYLSRERDLLYNLPDYIQKYSLDVNPFCDAPLGKDRYAIDALERSIRDILHLQSFDLLKQIQKEKDPKILDSLINQLSENLNLLGSSAGKHPQTGNTLLKELALTGDLDTLNLLISKNILPNDLGFWADYNDEVRLMEYAISSGDISKLKFAYRLFELMKSDTTMLYEAKRSLRRLHPKDPEIKQLKKDFKDSVEAEIYRNY